MRKIRHLSLSTVIMIVFALAILAGGVLFLQEADPPVYQVEKFVPHEHFLK